MLLYLFTVCVLNAWNFWLSLFRFQLLFHTQTNTLGLWRKKKKTHTKKPSYSFVDWFSHRWIFFFWAKDLFTKDSFWNTTHSLHFIQTIFPVPSNVFFFLAKSHKEYSIPVFIIHLFPIHFNFFLNEFLVSFPFDLAGIIFVLCLLLLHFPSLRFVSVLFFLLSSSLVEIISFAYLNFKTRNDTELSANYFRVNFNLNNVNKSVTLIFFECKM